MSLSKKIRFEVFKRDGFQCGYCGNTPPSVILEVDHVQPKSDNGSDDINNLLTACFDCNRGKKHIPLDKIPPSLKDNMEVLREKEEQLSAYNKLLRKIKKREDGVIEAVEQVFTSHFSKCIFTPQFKEVSLRQFVRKLDQDTLIGFMHHACSRVRSKDGSIRYFCGMCWNRIKNR